MAQFAPVAPPQILQALRAYGDIVIGRYHLLLSHDVAVKPHLYKGLLPRGSLVIMDNSVIELGYPVDHDTMQTALEIVPSQIVVLPDVIRDRSLTLDLSFQAADIYSDFMDFHNSCFMAVPQGNSLDELQECAFQLRHIEGIGAWGVGRFVTELLGTRDSLVRWLWESREMHLPSHKFGPFIHLLGFSEDMEDDMKCCRCPGVLGIDSAVPVRMGQQRQLISKTQKAHAPRMDWWDTSVPHIYPETLANLSLVRTWAQFG